MNLPPNKRPKQKPIRKTEASGEIILAQYPNLMPAKMEDKLASLTKLLTDGNVEEFNKKRDQIPPNLLNFSQIDLRGRNLSKANLSGVNLSKADLANTILEEVNLSNANMFKANLEGAHLREANLTYADLNVANLSNADLSKANLSKADLSHADLSRTNLFRTYFENTKVTNTKFIGTDTKTIVKDNLEGAIFELNDKHDKSLAAVDQSPQTQTQTSGAPVKTPSRKDNEKTYSELGPIKRRRYHLYVPIAVAAVIAIVVLAHLFAQFNPTNPNTPLTKQSHPIQVSMGQPSAYGQYLTTTENTSKTLTLKGNETGQIAIRFSINNNPIHGSLTSFDPKTGKIIYTPNPGFVGSDSFGFLVTDSHNMTSNIGNVSINVGSSPSITTPKPSANTSHPSAISYKQQVALYDKEKNCALDQHTLTTFLTYLSHFSCGHVTIYPNGTTVRRFTLIIDDYNGTGKNIPITKEGLEFPAWTYNGTIPGPTLRMTEGDHVMIDVINSKDSKFIHSWHVYSVHSGDTKAVMGNSGIIFPGQDFRYTFIARPYGIYPYHSHMEPVESEIKRGLYGIMIVDPPFNERRTPATEFVMLLNGYSYSDLNNIVGGGGRFVAQGPPTPQEMANATERAKIIGATANITNQVYSVNGMAFGYTGEDEIHLKVGQPVRIYLVNMLAFDPLNNFQLHGDMFHYTPIGTDEKPTMYTDIVSMMQGDRGILEFTYHNPGEFMFHGPDKFIRLGWMGFFNVTEN